MISTTVIFAQKDKESAVAEAAELLRRGETVVFPTETVYGLGANAFCDAAVKKIFEAKGRPQDNPLIVHIAEIAQLNEIAARVTDTAKKLAEYFWPGPLSVIVEKSERIPDSVSAGLSTVAVRLPQNEIARNIIARAGVPIAAPSANRSGRPSPTRAMHAYQDLCGRVPLIVDGGDCAVGVESTVVDARGEIPIILRPGGITPEQIKNAAGNVRVHPNIARTAAKDEICPSPGMKYRHYSPDAHVVLCVGDKKEVAQYIDLRYDNDCKNGRSAEIMCLSDCAPLYAGKNVCILGENERACDARLFAALRNADDRLVKNIYFHYDDRMGLAVKDRIGRAAGQKITV